MFNTAMETGIRQGRTVYQVPQRCVSRTPSPVATYPWEYTAQAKPSYSPDMRHPGGRAPMYHEVFKANEITLPVAAAPAFLLEQGLSTPLDASVALSIPMTARGTMTMPYQAVEQLAQQVQCGDCSPCSAPRSTRSNSRLWADMDDEECAGKVDAEQEGLPASQAPSHGSVGHPHRCADACKYALKKRGCKDGAQCDHCHLCEWNRYVVRGRARAGNRQGTNNSLAIETDNSDAVSTEARKRAETDNSDTVSTEASEASPAAADL